jgi:hypothetical protein
MDQHLKSELIKSYRKRYQRATKRDKTEIINRIVEATGSYRKHVVGSFGKPSSRKPPRYRERGFPIQQVLKEVAG